MIEVLTLSIFTIELILSPSWPSRPKSTTRQKPFSGTSGCEAN
jgi:hypothetical protein